MTMQITNIKDSFVENARKKAMKELNIFFQKKFDYGDPIIFMISDRKTLDEIYGQKTDRSLKAFVNTNRSVFMLDRSNFEKESSCKYDPAQYKTTIKHELCHCFFGLISKGYKRPVWLNEGLAMYLADQLKYKKCPDKFSGFLEFFNRTHPCVYVQSGFAVKALIKKFGRKKFLTLVKNLGEVKSKSGFAKLFKKIYKSNPTYKFFNSIYNPS